MHPKTTRFQLARGLGAALLLLVVTIPSGVAAQRPTPSVDTLLAWIASSDADRRNSGAIGTHRVFNEHYSSYTDAQRQQLLDGLDRIARGDVDADEVTVRRAMSRAFSALTVVGLDSTGNPTGIPEGREIPARVLRIYRETGRVEAKGMVIGSLRELIPRYPGPPAQEMMDLLVSVATAPEWTPDMVVPSEAIFQLLMMGGPAIPVLRRLHEEGAVKDVEARVFLREMAKRGYRPGG